MRVRAVKHLRQYGAQVLAEIAPDVNGSAYDTFNISWPNDTHIYQQIDDLVPGQKPPIQIKVMSSTNSRLRGGGIGCGNKSCQLRIEVMVTAIKKRQGAVNISDARGEIQGLVQRVVEITIERYLTRPGGIYNLMRSSDPPDKRNKVENTDQTVNTLVWFVQLRDYDAFGT